MSRGMYVVRTWTYEACQPRATCASPRGRTRREYSTYLFSSPDIPRGHNHPGALPVRVQDIRLTRMVDQCDLGVNAHLAVVHLVRIAAEDGHEPPARAVVTAAPLVPGRGLLLLLLLLVIIPRDPLLVARQVRLLLVGREARVRALHVGHHGGHREPAARHEHRRLHREERGFGQDVRPLGDVASREDAPALGGRELDLPDILGKVICAREQGAL